MVFVYETALTQTFTERKDQFNHLSTILKGRRKSCFTDLSKDKKKGLPEIHLGDTDWNNTPSLHKAPETQEISDEEVLTSFEQLAFHNSSVNFSSRWFGIWLVGFF